MDESWGKVDGSVLSRARSGAVGGGKDSDRGSLISRLTDKKGFRQGMLHP